MLTLRINDNSAKRHTPETVSTRNLIDEISVLKKGVFELRGSANRLSLINKIRNRRLLSENKKLSDEADRLISSTYGKLSGKTTKHFKYVNDAQKGGSLADYWTLTIYEEVKSLRRNIAKQQNKTIGLTQN